MENKNQNPKQQLIDALKESTNVLVTVSRDPSVDQLSAAIGLTLRLNQTGKHATAVFSGKVPSTLEFLKPEDTLEKNTDSLRDFIISLDKSKADKLRYKVEDKMVKIFITPYKTSITEADLVYGQGDFNVDVVVALGVHQKEELDEAIIAHGRILHDATIVSVNTKEGAQLGSINFLDTNASSLSEMVVSVCEALKPDALDAQMATALLTGIVAETQRFSNDKTSSETMNVSSKLMASGANQQLVATKLEQNVAPAAPATTNEPLAGVADAAQDIKITEDGNLNISHSEDTENNAAGNNIITADSPAAELPNIEPPEEQATVITAAPEHTRLILDPPAMGGTLTASSDVGDEDVDTVPDMGSGIPMLSHEKPDAPKAPQPQNVPKLTDQKPAMPVSGPQPVGDLLSSELLDKLSPKKPVQPVVEPAEQPMEQQADSQIEGAQGAETPSVDDALAAAHQAFDVAAQDPAPQKPAAEPQPLQEDIHPEVAALYANEPVSDTPKIAIDPNSGNLSYPTNLVAPGNELPDDPNGVDSSSATAPPPVPPPMPMPPISPPSQQEGIDPNNLPPVQP